ncbi:MAG: protein tyrosine kinase [Deltaproteobacteria bacterium]|nr:protein tyrosine kinase [Deltaproteobacteria bacterium]
MTKIRCDKCLGEFPLDADSMEEAKGGRVACRLCGSPVFVGGTDSVGEMDGPGGKDTPAGSEDEFERMLAGICEPDGDSAPPQGTVPPPVVLAARRDLLGKSARPAPLGSKKDASGRVTPAAPPPEPPKDAAPARPKEPEWTAPVRPTYTVSRSVSLDPDLMVENRCVAFFPEAPEMEPYRVLRTRIQQAAGEKGGNTVMITSALPREGKTLTAINLALTFSKTYLETALLVDCDLRQQRIHEVLGIPSARGLGDYLTGACSVSDMMVWPGVEKLIVISGGRTVSESSELLTSPSMKQLVEDMKGRYRDRYIFFDVPPVLSGADALAFAPLADHILFVVRAGTTPIPEARRALEMLPREKVIGLVLNRQPDR